MLGKKIEQMYRAQLFARADDRGLAYYFSAADFEGMEQTPFTFRAAAGHRLQGYFYAYPNPIEGRLVVFDHGMGGGHRSYMREIEMLARHGYRVFAYDHTGCMESEGAGTNGFAQSLCDLNDALNALKNDPAWGQCAISVMGHSWGAFSTMNIAALHPDVKHVVAMAGFVSVKQMLRQMFGRGIAKLFYKRLWGVEQAANPDFVGYDAAETLRRVEVPTLLIYCVQDPVVRVQYHRDVLIRALEGRENVRFLSMGERGHNPNYTPDAAAYLASYVADLTAKQKAGELETPAQKSAFVASWDWHRMTEQDEGVWAEIFETLAR
jgi:pimeloyl-ACP methyl ester carboxylesterase